MQKLTRVFLALLLTFSLVFTSAPSLVLAATSDDLDDAVELAVTTEDGEGEDITIDDFSEEELVEAEPDEIPESADDSLTDDLEGQMLLDVEGNGEVYYNVLPVDDEDGEGGKEYLADGKAAYSLLQRRALGINEENFAKLTVGEERDEETVCRTSKLGRRLKGRIVIRVEEKGEAYYIYPKNCRAYYTGTFEAAYELMKKLSLGITKANLARVRDNSRQKAKHSLRRLVYATAEEQDISITDAKTIVRDEVQKLHQCLRDARGAATDEVNTAERRDSARSCAQQTDLPRIGKLRLRAIKNTIHELRMEQNKDPNTDLRKLKLRAIHDRAQTQVTDQATDNSTE